MTSESQPILDLTDLAPARPKIKLESGEYDLLSSEDFDPIHAAQITKLGNEAEALQLSDLDEEGAKKLDDNLRAQVRVICPTMPEEELRSLPFQKLVHLMDFFLEKSGIEDGLPAAFVEIVNKRANRRIQNGRRAKQSRPAGKS